MREIGIMEPGAAAAVREGDHTAAPGSIRDADTITPEQPTGKRAQRVRRQLGSQIFRHTQYIL